jgi:hypothetical protein
MNDLFKIMTLLLSLFVLTTVNAQEIEIPCIETKVMCAQRLHGNYIIDNQVDYQALLNDRSSHSYCGSYQLPVIDFTQHTLLGVHEGAGGCEPPQLEHNIMKNENIITFNFIITQYGMCKRGYGLTMWCLIPKVSDLSKIKFNIVRKSGTN